jgi:hypothetical protein
MQALRKLLDVDGSARTREPVHQGFPSHVGSTGDKYLDGLLSDANQALWKGLEDSPRSISTIVDRLLPALERNMPARRVS